MNSCAKHSPRANSLLNEHRPLTDAALCSTCNAAAMQIAVVAQIQFSALGVVGIAEGFYRGMVANPSLPT